MTILRTNTRNPDFIALTTLLDAHFWELYGEVQARFDEYNKAETSDIDTALLIYDEDGKAVGCGCFIHFETGRAEIKRVFVLPEMRGKGVAEKLMQALENWAFDLGYRELILETGIQQESAIRLYQKLGYQRIDNYGFYKEVEVSICFGKALHP